METQETATNAFIANVSAIRNELEKLMSATDDHFSVSPEDVNWGSVGESASILEYLRSASRITQSAHNITN